MHGGLNLRTWERMRKERKVTQTENGTREPQTNITRNRGRQARSDMKEDPAMSYEKRGGA